MIFKARLALKRLNLSYTPKNMACRSVEISQIWSAIEYFLADDCLDGNAIYISGMPGTGKTSCMRIIIRRLNVKSAQNKVLFVNINAMSLNSPYHIYSQILENLTGNKLNPAKAMIFLERLFKNEISFGEHSKANKKLIIVIDELDYMLTSKQAILYNLFDWPSRFKNWKILVIGIANTINLPEILSQKINSRLGASRIVFSPYSREEIEEIIEKRLKGLNIIEPEAIEFCARKVSSLSGDIRLALSICRKSVENSFIESNSKEKLKKKDKITISEMAKSINTLSNTFLVKTIQKMPIFQKIVLASILLALGAKEETDFILLEQITLQTAAICKKVGEADLSDFVVLKILKNFEKSGIINCFNDNFKENLRPKIRVNVLEDEILFALEGDEILGAIFK